MTTTVLPRLWDSEFFGVRVFEARLHDVALEAVVAEAAEGGAECLYLFADAADLAGVEAATRAGARLVDLRMEFDGRLPFDPRASARRASSDDRDVLVRQARELSAESRFARDPRFARERVREMYGRWLDRCLDEGVVAVPEAGGGGFVGARRDGDSAAIELVYVDEASRGQGLGGALVRAAARALDATDVNVVTQVGNVAAQRLYQSLGLRSRSTLAVLHLWLDERRV
jgi:dTDP-4-amino-4,6-dideoxy-D-galactose acyltransferase